MRQRPLHSGVRSARTDYNRRIPNLTSPELIKAFFGDVAEPYNYSVSQDEFDRDDNEGPGRYSGVGVPDKLGDLWDAGIIECRKRNVDAKSAEGLQIRLTVRYPDGPPAEARDLVAAHLAKVQAQAEERMRPKREEEEGKRKVEELTAGLVATQYGPSIYDAYQKPTIYHDQYGPIPVIDRDRDDKEVLDEPVLTFHEAYIPPPGMDIRKSATLWKTRHGYVYRTLGGQYLHYVSAERARMYRLEWAKHSGIDKQKAQDGIASRWSTDDMRAMYQGVLDEATV